MTELATLDPINEPKCLYTGYIVGSFEYMISFWIEALTLNPKVFFNDITGEALRIHKINDFYARFITKIKTYPVLEYEWVSKQLAAENLSKMQGFYSQDRPNDSKFKFNFDDTGKLLNFTEYIEYVKDMSTDQLLDHVKKEDWKESQEEGKKVKKEKAK